ncbi:hypothetical protein [Thermomonas sp.]
MTGNKKLDSGLRRNDEDFCQAVAAAMRQPQLQFPFPQLTASA